MKRVYQLCVLLLLFVVNTVAVVAADTTCSGYNPSRHPLHYCDCKGYVEEFYELPFELQVTDSLWFKSSSDVFMDGFTAYLYSDCDVNFDIYQNCTAKNALYSVVIPKGQARDVSAETIKQKLEGSGFYFEGMVVYICVYPVGGTGGRLMCLPYNTGYNSTCNDILALLPGMTFVSSHAETVYEITPDNIADSYAMFLQWTEESSAPCSLEITRGNCNGEVIASHNFTANDDIYVLDAALLMDARAKGESLYAHFSHSASVVGRINFAEATHVEVLTDTVICQGKVFEYGNYTTNESGIYFYDTVRVSSIEFEVLGFNIMFAEPELQYDTLALRNSQLPYEYRGEMISEFGDYDLVIETPGECDEHIALNVRHNLTVVNLVKDTTICYGGRFDYEGDSYLHDVTLVGDSIWNDSRDTVTINVINVYFNTQNFVYDTLALTIEEAKLYRYKGITIRGFGDYEIDTYDEYMCAIKLYLNVCHKVTNIVEVVDTTLCDGDVYLHSDGVEYRASVELVDSGWQDEDTYLHRTINVRFITNELTYDTLFLAYADLPYLYKGQVQIEEMNDTTVSVLFGKCSGQVSLRLVHKFETVTEEEEITLCEGKVYEHNGVKYSKAETIVDSTWVDRDTFEIRTTHLQFVAPEVAHDTLALRATELPFVYREQYTIPANGFGAHDFTIHNEGECNERINLYVIHLIDTVDVVRDTTLCQGKGFEYGDSLYLAPVTLIDSTWMGLDTLSVTTIRVHFVAPEMQYDTLALKTSDLPYRYRGQYEVNDFGDYETTIHTEGECDELYRISVYHKIDTIVTAKDSLICFGGRYQYEKDGKSYTARNDISFGTETILNADTVILDSLHVRFAKVPDSVYDTIMVPTAELTKGYKYTIYNKTINSADDYQWEEVTNTVTKCKENAYIHVTELAEEVLDITVCQGKGYEHKGVIYYEPTTLIDSAWVSDLKFQITTTRLHFVAPEAQYDTIAIRAAELPYDYRGHLIADFGEYELKITTVGECDELVNLYVSHTTTTLTAERDTTICQGKAYEHNGEFYYEPVELEDSAWLNRDTLMLTSTRVHFAAPEVEYDTVVVEATILIDGYYYEIADTYVYEAGTYEYEIEVVDECTQLISLTVEATIPNSIDDVIIETKPKLIMIDGIIYVYHNGDYYSLTGQKMIIK